MKIKIALIFLFCISFFAYGQIQQSAQTNTPNPISVSVTGDVQTPGIYTLNSFNRVSDAVDMADQINLNASPAKMNALPSVSAGLSQYKPSVLQDTTQTVIYGRRSITLIRDGQKQSLDLLSFFRLGDITQNPFLHDGDIIIVNPVRQRVTVEGDVNKPGDYEFKEGDTIGSILDLALGVKDDAALKHIVFYRYAEDFVNFEQTELDLSGYPDKPNPNLNKKLQAGDRILIPTDTEFRKAYKVTVTGKVKLPGTYYVKPDATLYDLMVLCGGPTQEADLSGAFLYNRTVSENLDPDFERLSKYTYSQMTWLEYTYLRTKCRQLKGKYSVSVSQCWNTKGEKDNPILRDGDALYVPEMLNGVWVAGQVKNPGLVTYRQDWKWKDYLQAAGGYANNRKLQGTRIIRTQSGNWIKPTNKIQIASGDVIFVPDKEEIYAWDHVKNAILLASQVLTIIVAIRTFGL